MSMRDKNDRPWAKLSEVKAGDVLIADGGFTCIEAGPVKIKSDECNLYFDCCEDGVMGKHHLLGQADDGEYLIGLYKPETV